MLRRSKSLADGGLQTEDALMEVLQVRDVLQDRKDIRRADPNSLLAFIGNTPLIQISRLTKHLKGVQIFVKAEWLNPGGSVKDRAGLRIIEDGERSGELTRDKIILDSTSGNTGIAYAMIGAFKGYRVELVVPANVSEERKKALEAYGVNLIFTDPLMGSDGALLEAKRIYETNPNRYFKGDQYNNPSNWRAHYETTGLEILHQSKGRVTHFIACVGTGGTLMGTGRRLKEYNPRMRLFGVQPDSGFHGIEGLKHIETAIRPGIYDESILDGTFFVKTEDAYEMMTRLAKEEGLWVGPSSGAAFWASIKLAESIDRGVIVTIFPDGGERYPEYCPGCERQKKRFSIEYWKLTPSPP
jgi:cysteine synthase B